MYKINYKKELINLTKSLGEIFKQSETILPRNVCEYVDHIGEIASKGSNRGIWTVAITSLFYKIYHPDQDIRKHQNTDVPYTGGYSGRSFDTSYITPALTELKFPSMAESGWLTRSLEQKSPYNLDYPGNITHCPLIHLHSHSSMCRNKYSF